MREYVNKEKFHSPILKFLHVDLKNIFVFGADKALKTMPQDKVMDSYDKLQNSELQRQWVALDNAIKHFQGLNRKGFNLGGPGLKKEFTVVRDCYFSIMESDANYLKLVSRFMLEYAKLRGWRK